MTRARRLPRIALTWSLMLLAVIAGGVRPSCIRADGSLCLLCPKLMAPHTSLPSAEPAPSSGSCSSKSCCCEHAAAPTRSKSIATSETTGSACEGCDCFAVQSVAPATVQKVDDPTSRLDFDAAPAVLATVKLMLSRESSCWRGDTHRVGPPPDLIVLLQRWLI